MGVKAGAAWRSDGACLLCQMIGLMASFYIFLKSFNVFLMILCLEDTVFEIYIVLRLFLKGGGKSGRTRLPAEPTACGRSMQLCRS